ncbi:MAG: phage tail protein [Allosphingosinicella sp.]
MSDKFVAEIRVVGFNFAPTGWALCNGQLIPISQNTALFSLLGTNYGGDCESTFALPDIQGSVVLGPGQGPGLSDYDVGQIGGADFVTLLESEMPLHTHNVRSNITPATLGTGAPNTSFARSVGGNAFKGGAANVVMAPQSLAPAGGSLPHTNLMPYLTLNYVIALPGEFPAQS